jgi:hypothetical protein
MGHVLKPLLAGVIAACLAGPAEAAGQDGADPFAQTHRREAEANEPGRTVTIRTRDGRTAFQPREPIEIELTITPGNGVNVDTRVPGCGFQMTEVVAEPAAGVSTPYTPLVCPPAGEAFSAGVVGGIMGGSQPWTMTFLLNGPYRIDRAGRLRLFVKSRHTHLADTSRHETSNVLTLDIQPRDAAWEAQAARSAGSVLEDPTAPPEKVAASLRSLGVLATPDAARALLARVDPKGQRPALHAMFALDDRAVALRLMEDELQRADRPVDGNFVSLLAQLARAGRNPDGTLPHDDLVELVEHYSLVRARTLAAASTLREAIVADFERSTEWDVALSGSVAAAIQHFPRETALAITWLNPTRLEKLLRRNARRFSHLNFVPLLRTLHEIYPREIATLALRYLLAVAPDEGRSRILEELSRDVPRVTIETMGRLPDATFPALEAAWVDLLEASLSTRAVTAAAQRLERFGTAAGAARAAQAWLTRHDEWPTEIDGPLFAYLARVEPRLAERTLAVAAANAETLHGAGRDQALPLAIGRLEWNETVERFAVASLDSPDDYVAAQAASALAAYGTAAGRPAIEAALLRLRGAWPRSNDEGAIVLEGEFARALVSAVGWRLTARSRAVAHARCIGDRCDYHLQSEADPQIVERVIYMLSAAEDERRSAFSLDGVELSSVPVLITKLRQYPAGTRFSFDPMRTSPTPFRNDWTERERQSLFEDVRSAAVRHGIMVTSEQTPIRPASVGPSVRP